MTNEEKAREIAYAIANPVVTLENRHSIEYTVEGKIRKSALEMAKWKDKQFRECLERKLSQEHPNWNGYECNAATTIITEIINELFPNDEECDTIDNDE